LLLMDIRDSGIANPIQAAFANTYPLILPPEEISKRNILIHQFTPQN